MASHAHQVLKDCTHLKIEVEPRYWEDAMVNGVEDAEGTLIPHRQDDLWIISISLKDGRVERWPDGLSAQTHYKVCDAGTYWLTGPDGNAVARYKHSYVPNQFLCHGTSGHGDYVILDIQQDGQIKGYTPPRIDPDDWQILKESTVSRTEDETYQSRVRDWVMTCFGEASLKDPILRGDRMLEEVFELLQAADYPVDRVDRIREYSFAREKGVISQEVGGVMSTLAAFCTAMNIDMKDAAEAEYARISTPEIIAKIRVKEAEKARALRERDASAQTGSDFSDPGLERQRIAAVRMTAATINEDMAFFNAALAGSDISGEMQVRHAFAKIMEKYADMLEDRMKR